MSKKRTYDRKEVWRTYMGEADRGNCLCCNTEPITKNNFHVGHIEAKSKGGSDDLINLRPICGWCNTRMGATNMVVFQKEKHPNAVAIKVGKGPKAAKGVNVGKKVGKGTKGAKGTMPTNQDSHVIFMPTAVASVVPMAPAATQLPHMQPDDCFTLHRTKIFVVVVIICVITVTILALIYSN